MGNKHFAYSVIRAWVFCALAVLLVNGAWAKEKVLYSFSGGSDGGDPASALTSDGSGNLYGTTVVGGAGYGTVFELSPASNGRWKETVLYSFSGGSDGKNPYGGVIFDSAGKNLYGTTVAGGTGGVCVGDGCGVVFELTPSGSTWNESVIHNFKDSNDGNLPGGALVFDKAGNLYGTTPDGGTHQLGTVYTLTLGKNGQWKEKVIHNFTGGRDGAVGSLGSLLTDGAGNVYGVSELGGSHGAGTAFAMSMSGGKWKLNTLYGFRGQPNAGFPYGGLIFDKAGNLYGTTGYGGKNGLGSVFKLTNVNGKWRESRLYSFKGGKDGSLTTTTLVFDASGNLYGTTSMGGDTGCDCGTVFKLTPVGSKWKESVVHRFHSVPDGANPSYGLMLDGSGNLYGTTATGGIDNQGSIFEITP